MSELDDQELESFEDELKKVRAAPTPQALVNRLLAVGPALRPELIKCVQSEPRGYSWGRLLRWLAPATALGVFVAITLGRHYLPITVRTGANSEQPKASSMPRSSMAKGSQEDEFEIGRSLIATFDAVAELPSGEPVRFRCQQWADTTIFRDRALGIAVERSSPRLEIVPVSLDTY